MAHKAEIAAQGWSVDPMEDVILGDTMLEINMISTHTVPRSHSSSEVTSGNYLVSDRGQG